MSRQGILILVRVLAATLLPLAGYFYLKLNPAHDPIFAAPRGHFWIVSSVSALAAAAAVAVGVAGARLRNIQVTFLSLAFTSLALVFVLHGLSTPGFLLPMTQVPAMAAQLSILLTAFWLWLSAAPSDHPLVVRLAARQQWLVPLWTAFLIGMGAALMAEPDLVSFIPIHLSPLKWGVTAIVLGLAALSAHHYWRSYRYARFPLQLAILYSIGWLAGSQIIMATGELWRTSWWLYHFLLLFATLVMLSGVMQQYATGASVGAAVRGLMASNPAERIEAGLAPSIRALIVATETRDRYTAGHNYRVAVLALHLAEAMGLPPESLRALALGGIVHDVGKIEVPDHILNKPGRLTPEERAVVERHPVTGYEMCKRLGFMPEELTVIRHHHERWDGTGYPDRLKGEQIPMLARILAIVDVYDALTSDRSYRKAWSHEAAMRLIAEQAGKQFDPACVEVWVRIADQAVPAVDCPSWLEPQQGRPETA